MRNRHSPQPHIALLPKNSSSFCYAIFNHLRRYTVHCEMYEMYQMGGPMSQILMRHRLCAVCVCVCAAQRHGEQVTVWCDATYTTNEMAYWAYALSAQVELQTLRPNNAYPFARISNQIELLITTCSNVFAIGKHKLYETMRLAEKISRAH